MVGHDMSLVTPPVAGLTAMRSWGLPVAYSREPSRVMASGPRVAKRLLPSAALYSALPERPAGGALLPATVLTLYSSRSGQVAVGVVVAVTGEKEAATEGEALCEALPLREGEAAPLPLTLGEAGSEALAESEEP